MNQMSKNKMRISLNCLELYSKRISYMKVFNSFIYIKKKKILFFLIILEFIKYNSNDKMIFPNISIEKKNYELAKF